MGLSKMFDEELRNAYPGKVALSIREFATAIGFHDNSVRSMLSRKQIRIVTLKIGKRRLVPIVATADFLADREFGNISSSSVSLIGYRVLGKMVVQRPVS